MSVLQGIRPFDRSRLSSDVVAGVTLAALAIPEVMGYTKIAGTPVITGLYTILLPAVAFAILGSSRHLVVGGDSATAAIMYAGIAGLGISGLQPGTSEWLAYASLAALITGGILILARIAKLGFLADFISRTVLVGFLTGVGIQVALGQFAGMLGVASPKVSLDHLSGTVIKFWDTLKEIPDTSLATLAVSLAVIATLIVFEKWIPMIPGGLVAVVGAIAISWGFDLEAHGVSTLGVVPSGLPSIGLPSGVGWNDIGPLLATCVSMFLVIIAQSAATSRAYAVEYKEHFEENTDIVGLSLANIAAGLSSTFVVNGSPTKSKMAEEAKASSQVAMLAMAVMVAIVLLFLTKPLQYMPNAVLAAVVFVIGVKLIDWKHMKEIYVLRRDEFWIAAVTAAVVVGVGVEQGVILAIVLSLLDHVRRHYNPHDAVITRDDQGKIISVPAEPGAVTEQGLVVYRFRGRVVLRQRRPLHRGGDRPRRRPRTAQVVHPARQRGRRRRLHRRQDPGRARRATQAARRHLRGRRRPRRRPARTRPIRAHRSNRRGAHLRNARRRHRFFPREQAVVVAEQVRGRRVHSPAPQRRRHPEGTGPLFPIRAGRTYSVRSRVILRTRVEGLEKLRVGQLRPEPLRSEARPGSAMSSQPTIESFLIPSKTRVPDVREGTIRRHALVERLLGSEQRIISVTAPGGYGKSLLLARWASDDPRPLAWLSLDPDDSDTTLFLQYVALALVHAGILEADRLPGSMGMANARSLLPSIRAALATSRPFVLVVDDTQWLRGDALDALLLLARDIPRGSQLVLSGRSDLGRLLARGRLAGETLELTAGDLALDDSEARELLENVGLELSDAVVNDLNSHVEGWAAGLYLSASVMRNTGSLPDFGETHVDRFVSDFFEPELARLPEAQLDFLRESSALTRMCPELCDAALCRNDSRRMLEEIEASNLFLVPLDHERLWYRYHDLFRAALLRQLERSDPTAGNRIRRRASEWFELHGSADLALRCALTAGDDDRAARLLCSSALPLYRLGRAATLEECFARFDDPMMISKYPAMSALGAFLHALNGRPFQAERWLDAAARGLGRPDSLSDGSQEAELWVKAIRAVMCQSGPAEMRRDAEAAMTGFAPSAPLFGLVLWLHATTFYLTGDLDEAERYLAGAVEVAGGTGNIFLVMNGQAQRALLALERGDDEKARALLALSRQGVDAEDYHGYMNFALVAAAQARIEARTGDMELARAALAVCQRLRPLLTRAIPWYSVQTLLEMAETYCDLGEVNAARALILEAVEILRHVPDLGILGSRVRRLQAQSVSRDDGHSGWEWSLTTAELRLLPLLMTHLTLSEVAERLEVSYNTVKTQTTSIYRKLDVSSRSAAVRRAAELGLLEAVPA